MLLALMIIGLAYVIPGFCVFAIFVLATKSKVDYYKLSKMKTKVSAIITRVDAANNCVFESDTIYVNCTINGREYKQEKLKKLVRKTNNKYFLTERIPVFEYKKGVLYEAYPEGESLWRVLLVDIIVAVVITIIVYAFIHYRLFT